MTIPIPPVLPPNAPDAAMRSNTAEVGQAFGELIPFPGLIDAGIAGTKALIKANSKFMKLGYKIKLYDCYRPLDIQKRMWAIVSNPNYVANPSKGSIHNRGGAVDITLVDSSGKELNMGTPFDFFGPEASHDYRNFPIEILENRALFKKIMLSAKFQSFDSEWWHYNLKNAKSDPISNFKWKCN